MSAILLWQPIFVLNPSVEIGGSGSLAVARRIRFHPSSGLLGTDDDYYMLRVNAALVRYMK